MDNDFVVGSGIDTRGGNQQGALELCYNGAKAGIRMFGMQKSKSKKLIFTSLAWLLEGYALGVLLFVYLLLKSFLRPGDDSYSELLIMLTIAILATLLGKWIDKRYSSIIVSGRPRRIWRHCCFAALLVMIIIYGGKYFYDQREIDFEFLIIILSIFLFALYTGKMAKNLKAQSTS